MPLRVFITAAEVSGDKHAAQLVRSLKALDPTIEAEGLGGREMAAAGAVIHHETVKKAAMFFGGVGRAREMHGLLRWTRKHYAQQPPNLHVCVDSSGVNLHFAALARSFGVPVLYYIAPQLWASRPGRIAKVRAFVTRVACILPFEEAYYRERGVRADFVGHPLFDELPPERKQIIAAREPDIGRIFTIPEGPRIAMIAGSRRAEVRANFPHLLNVAAGIVAEFPSARFLLPTTDAGHETVRQLLADSPLQSRCEVELHAFDQLLPQCDFALVKSGTSTLQVAAWGIPMIVVFRTTAPMWHLLAKHLLRTPKIALVNILAGNVDLVPEVIPWYGSDEPVKELALSYLRSPEKRMAQRRALLDLVATLDRPGASLNAAKIAREMMKGS